MPYNENQLQQLIKNPSEGLSLELKDWINPTLDSGICKIVKGVIALRNNNGGNLLIGFNDKDGSLSDNCQLDKIEQLFHVDEVQRMVNKYSSEQFELFVYYPRVLSKTCVVIEIPHGVKVPVLTKAFLEGDSYTLIKQNVLYTRTLKANNTVSTAEATWKDWPRIMDICFENREADIGRFINRHLKLASDGKWKETLQNILSLDEQPSNTKQVTLFLEQSKKRYDAIVDERKLILPEHGSFEVGVLINGDIGDHKTNMKLLNLLSSTNPRYTGWPAWTDSRSFSQDKQPFTYQGFWESFINALDNGHLDYWRISPNGMFYLYRALQDDTSQSGPKPLKVLDFNLTILRVCEYILVSMAFAKALGCNEDTNLEFAFRWSGISNRELSSWANPSRFLDYEPIAKQDDVFIAVEIPVQTAATAVYQYVDQITSKLFEAFEGYEISENVIEEICRSLIERKLF